MLYPSDNFFGRGSMVFSSITFLFFFLPSVLLLYWLAGKNGRNLLLLAASLLFYAWGEGVYLLLMLVSILGNYIGGRIIGNDGLPGGRRLTLVAVVFFNLLILGFFKYATFLTENINLVLAILDLPLVNLHPVRLPIGISFFTFQALSYIIDVYRKRVVPQKKIVNLALYISLFPQLIAGPIVRYNDISKEIDNRSLTAEKLAEGIQRFLFGLSKKVLLANPMGIVADQIFSLPETELTTPVAWLGAVCYTLQIYFDFSGYSDMAIGLGRMFGFRFPENFNYPYISRSIRSFWRRWHISLSSWFRDYLYISLGGNRLGDARTCLNLFAVFFLCGLWHGAAWTFIIWGLYHGFFLVLERTAWGRVLEKLWAPLRVIVTMLIVIFGWVIFRSETIPEAIGYLATMVGQGHADGSSPSVFKYLNAKNQFELVMALVIALPVYPLVQNLWGRLLVKLKGRSMQMCEALSCFAGFCLISALGYFSIISLAAGVYNPFIYFRF